MDVAKEVPECGEDSSWFGSLRLLGPGSQAPGPVESCSPQVVLPMPGSPSRSRLAAPRSMSSSRLYSWLTSSSPVLTTQYPESRPRRPSCCRRGRKWPLTSTVGRQHASSASNPLRQRPIRTGTCSYRAASVRKVGGLAAKSVTPIRVCIGSPSAGVDRPTRGPDQPATRADQISRSRIRTSVRSWPRLTSSRRVARSALRLRSRSRL